MISLSVVVPVYSGEAYLSVLLDEIGAVRKDLECRGMPLRLDEVIFVDDGAIDGSAAIIDKLADSFGYVTALHLSRNFGQHPATIAGILHTSGDWVVTLDEDMQHPPSRIIDLFEVVVKSGADVVYGRPKSNVHQSVTRDFSSRKFKAIIERLTGNKHISKANSFRLVRGSVARAASSVCGHDTYFDIALSWFTQRIESRQMVLKDTRFIETGKSG
ncbi:MAG: glycosyl transferase 2 family protein, partial [Hyphomicrobiales bacterium]|nr:glycosyl transferase 2 family protein [Hyphomicrobiales bacterium]